MQRIVPKKVAIAVIVCAMEDPRSAHPHIFDITTIKVESAGSTMTQNHLHHVYNDGVSVPFFMSILPSSVS